MAPPWLKPPTATLVLGMPASTCCCTISSMYLHTRSGRGQQAQQAQQATESGLLYDLLHMCACTHTASAACLAGIARRHRRRSRQMSSATA